jgi:hypothetical protein
MSRPKLAKISSKGTLALKQGLASVRERKWRSAFSHLTAADQAASLTGDELEALAIAAHLSGNEARALELLARIHQAHLDEGNIRRAARFAFWLGFIALNEGQHAQSNGWFARASRLLEDQEACPEHGYLLIPAGIRAARSGEIPAATAAFIRAGQIGKQFADKDLMTMARNGLGRALIRDGEHAKGNKLLDEAMVAVIAGEVLRSLPAACTAACSNPVARPMTYAARRSGLALLTSGALTSPNWSPTVAIVFSTAPSFSSFVDPGVKHYKRHKAPEIVFPSPRQSPHLEQHYIVKASFTAFGANSRKPKRPSFRPRRQATRRSRASLCCAWRKADWTPRQNPSANRCMQLPRTRLVSLLFRRKFWKLPSKLPLPKTTWALHVFMQERFANSLANSKCQSSRP